MPTADRSGLGRVRSPGFLPTDAERTGMTDAGDDADTSDGPDPSRKRPVERTIGDAEPGPTANRTSAEGSEPLLARVPEWVVPLGAGCLLTATLITLATLGFVVFSLLTGRTYGYARWQLVLALVQFGFVTLLLGLGTRYARQRRRWLVAMLAALAGTLTFIAAPLTVPALVCLGLGKYHFSLDTPADQVSPDDA